MMIYTKLTFMLILLIWSTRHYWLLDFKAIIALVVMISLGFLATVNPVGLMVYSCLIASVAIIRFGHKKDHGLNAIIAGSWLGLAVSAAFLTASWFNWAVLLVTIVINLIELLKQQHYRPLIVMTICFDTLVLTVFPFVDAPLQLVLTSLAGLMILITTSLIHYLFQETDMVFARSLDKMMTSYTQEVQTLYEGMRGWRHDYHDHLQTLKAYLDQQEVKEARHYLDDLEDKLQEVDPIVHSGNPVLDAVVNSKLTLAERLDVETNVKVFVGTQPLIHDVDLVVIIGNLMDNALEAIAEQNSDEQRLLRVYISILKQQLYISITNSRSADQIIDPEYASTKNDKRGLGIRRINHLVDSYDGMINRQYQPGVFVTEILLPLTTIHAAK